MQGKARYFLNISIIDPPRMRTIRQAAQEAGVPEHWLRRAVKENRVVYVMAGNKALVNLDKLFEYLNTGEGVRP